MIGTETVSRRGGAAGRLKVGREKRSKLGKEKRLKFGKERLLKFGNDRRLRFGKELAVAAPMMAKADKDAIITGIRFEATCGAASGCLSPCVSLSGASVTCVPYVSAPSQDFSSQPRLSRECSPD